MSRVESSAPRRKHTTTACRPCRDSKVKCDGDLPTCATCRTRGKQCQYQASEDKRRLSHRLVVELLFERIEELTRVIRQSGQDCPAMNQEKHSLLINALGHLRLLDAVPDKALFRNDGLAASPSRQSFKIAEVDGSSGNKQASNMFSHVPELNRAHQDQMVDDERLDSSLPNQRQMATMPGVNEMRGTEERTMENMSVDVNTSAAERLGGSSSSVFTNCAWSEMGTEMGMSLLNANMPDFTGFQGIDLDHGQLRNGFSDQPLSDTSEHHGNTTSDSHRTETLVKQLADRIGSLHIGPGGQVRYEGPTSNFNLVDMGEPDNLTIHRSVRHDGPEYLKRLDIGKDVPTQFEDHLLNLYFAWQDPAFHVVKRSMFDQAKAISRNEQQDTPYFSEALLNALCSLGAAFESRHHPTFTTYPRSLADFFADRAKTLLEIELDAPCVATVQTLIVLSGHDIGCKRDSRGWLYSGMATRLAFHLALHLDMTTHVSSGSITQQEVDLRRDIFWAAYTVDHIWSCYLGRAFHINMESVTLGPPDAVESVDPIGQWSPYVSAQSPPDREALPDPTVEIHRQRVLLCEIMAPLGFALYGNLGMDPSALHQLNLTTVAKLLAWKETLPDVLRVNVDNCETLYLPHVLLLHMLYHQNIIYAHRPWMVRRADGVESHLMEGHNPEHARATCIESAISIGKLLQIYEHHYGLRRIHVQAVGITCSAALLLIFAVVICGETEQKAQLSLSTDPALYLGVCFNALDAFAAAWESARKAREFLNLLQRRWEREALQRRDLRTAFGGGDMVPNKRQRVPNGDGEERRTMRPWSGSRVVLDGALDTATFQGDLGWLLMNSETSPGSVFEGSATATLHR